jgi:glutamyl-tRNA reductase
MRLVLIGLNHQTAPVEIREGLRLACEGDDLWFAELARLTEIREALYLSTCNRVEVLARVSDGERAVEALKEFICRHVELPAERLSSCLYVHRDGAAVRHFFRVAASLDSLVMGEPQILGQVKEAYRRAVDHRATGILINRLVHHAFRVAKRVRTETGIADNAVSVSYAAVQLARKIFGDLAGKTILLLGAGEMAELAARHLLGQGVARMLIANRTEARAAALADQFRGTAVPFDRFGEVLPEVDIVIASTGAPGFVIGAPMVAEALRRRRNRLLFLIDIAVPRNIDPKAGEIDNVFLYNIDHLQGVVDANRQRRGGEAQKAEGIVAAEVAAFERWFNALEVVPTIVALREKLERIQGAELAKAAWLERLPEAERRRVEVLTASILNKVLHDPIVGLKEESRQKDALPYVAAIRRLFNL